MKHIALLIIVLFALAGCGTLQGDGLVFKTADPRINIGFRLLPPAPPLPESTPAALPEATATPDCVIKVNQSADGTFIYHLPGQASYSRTLIEPVKNEFFACTEQQAIDVGARKALR